MPVIMKVTGGRETAARLRALPALARTRIEEAIERAADMVLADMKGLVPRDSGALAAGLSRIIADSGLSAAIGLPTARLANDYFYARFIEYGTRGGDAHYRHRRTGKRVTVRVPARPARPFMEPAWVANRGDVIRLIRDALAQALRDTRR